MSVRTAIEEGGRLARVTLDAGKGNVLDGAHADELRAAFEAAEHERSVRCVLLDAAGPHFCFGASVEEHRPAEVRRMLGRFHAMIGRLLELSLPVLTAVRGQCLGGGLELALATSRIVAHPSARLGQPEIKLGVFAPAGSVLLPLRVGLATSELLLLTGRTWSASEALAARLVDDLCADDEDPSERARVFARQAYFPLSPASIRLATRAARGMFAAIAIRRLAELERLYLDELAESPDAREGIGAFLEKRPPRWDADRGAS